MYCILEQMQHFSSILVLFVILIPSIYGIITYDGHFTLQEQEYKKVFQAIRKQVKEAIRRENTPRPTEDLCVHTFVSLVHVVQY